MRKLILIVALALAIPAVALATRPPHPTTPASSHPAKPTVLWVLRGTLSGYTAASGSTNGSISIKFKSANFHSQTLKT